MDNFELLNSKIKTIADEVRQLSGSTNKMGLDAIAVNVSNGNAEIILQKELLERAICEMEGKVDPQLYENGYADGYSKGCDENNAVVAGIVDRTIVDFANNAVTSFGANAFRGCSKLKTVNAPNAVDVWSNCFSDCTQLETIYLPNVNRIWQYAFLNCFALTNVVLTNATIIYSRAFDSCRSIPKFDFHKLQTIESYAFTGGAALNTVIIRTETVCKLNSIDAFNNTPIAKGTGFVYVPNNLVEQYKTATNWAAYATQIKPLSELGEQI